LRERKINFVVKSVIYRINFEVNNKDSKGILLSRALQSRVSDPHIFHADPDPGFEIFKDADPGPDLECKIFANPDPDPGLIQKLGVFYVKKSIIKTLDPDQNADPDPGTQKNADPYPDPGRS